MKKVELLQDELETAAHRMKIMAETVEKNGLLEIAKLYRQWAEQASYVSRKALEMV